MENRYVDLFCVIFTLNSFVLFLSFTEVTSVPVSTSIIEVMKNDSKLKCLTSKFLYDSEYVEPCVSKAYPTAPWKYNRETFPGDLNNFLCLGIYDTAYKICHYSSQLQSQSVTLNSTATFNSYVKKYVFNKNETHENFCNKLQGFTSLYDKINPFWEQLVKSLNEPDKCLWICFDFEGKFQPLCAVFAWIKSIDDMMKSTKQIETKHGLVNATNKATNKSYIISQLKVELIGNKTADDSKKIETKESIEQNRKISDSKNNNNNNNSVKDDGINIPDNALDVKFKEKTKSDTETNNNQKKINHTLETQIIEHTLKKSKGNIEPGINAEVPKPTKDVSPNSDLQVSSINKDVNTINKEVNEENIEKSKEQDTNDLKSSTLSENTQDHNYDAENPEENMENDIDDGNDIHPDIGNQNENVQKAFEKKNNNARLTEYSNMRLEDDSHFFTYFTVITLACLAGYIGYHNKQKILAIVLEGRRSRNNRGRRRPSTASYRKLDCTLEEAVTSQCNANVTHVIY